MFELTNAQRKCFGLVPVDPSWVRVELKSGPYHLHTTISYLDGTVLRKFIQSGDLIYTEYELCEQLSDDLLYLLPKTPRGKPVPLSASTLEKRTGRGMCLSYLQRFFTLYSLDSQKCRFVSCYNREGVENIQGFQRWVENWCQETTPEDLDEIASFAAHPLQHIKYREGDVFRFPINRRLYGYGRIILDYRLMKKKHIPFWDVFPGHPLACSVYHIATERKDASIEELKNLNSLPAVHIMDNHLYYGGYEIIGNIPIREQEDYPIMYGISTHAYSHDILLQCGKLYKKLENTEALYHQFRYHSIGFELNFTLPMLLKCIEEGSNAPYWEHDSGSFYQDLRNPKHRAELAQVCKQFDVVPEQLLYEFQH